MEAPVPAHLVRLLALGAGLSAAGLYYNQPLLDLLIRSFHASPGEVGLVPMLTQLGYAAGILLFAPIGDRYDRRQIILYKSVGLVAAHAFAAAAPSLAALWVASFLIGIFATIAQDCVPAAAALAPPTSRGKTVGRVMTGLLVGILLSRVASGAIADRLGWRAVFAFAAVSVALYGFGVARRIPRFAPSTCAPYGELLLSLLTLVRDRPTLRRAALAQALMSVAFSAFWSTLALVLAAPPYQLGSAVAGAFGIAGAAGALGAPLFGGIADRRGPERVIRIGALLVVAAFAGMGLLQGSLWVLVLGAVMFDLGVQAALIAHQTIIYGLDPEARSRVNAVLVTSLFLGMAVGSSVASRVLPRFGWTGVCVLAAGAGVLALVVRLWPGRRVRLIEKSA